MLGYNESNAGIQFVCDQPQHASSSKGVSGIGNIIFDYHVKTLTSLPCPGCGDIGFQLAFNANGKNCNIYP